MVQAVPTSSEASVSTALAPTLPSQPWHLAATLAAFVGLGALLTMKLHELQVARADDLADIGARQRVRTWTVPAVRGNVYDAAGAPLALSEATWTLRCDPPYMNDKLTATVELSRILNLPREVLRAQFESDRSGRTLAKGIPDPDPTLPGSRDIPEEIRAAIRQYRLTGLLLERETTRRYPEPGLAAHIVGFTQADGSGGMGIEQTFDQALTGTPGRQRLHVDAHGAPRLDDDASAAEGTPAIPGAHVQLTLSMDVQRILEKRLREGAEHLAPKGIAGVVLRPDSGEILALASWPSFSPEDRAGFTPERLRNNVLTLVYEPGSTLKPLIAGAVVADRLASWHEQIDCERGAWTYRVGRSARTIHEKTGGHGVLSVADGIAFSDNILMAKLGVRLTPDRLRFWISELGFGVRTGVGLPGDEPGILPPKRAWNPLDSNMSIPMGHGIAVTPLQLALAHAAVANGGVWHPPRLLRRVWRDTATGAEELPLPETAPSRRIFSGADALGIQNAMAGTMTDGTGKRVQLDGYSSAGKTGTAEKLRPGGGYDSGRNIGSFVCFAPATPGVRAELLCLVVVDEPTRNGRFGADTAAPMVRDILQASLESLAVPKTEPPRQAATPARPRGRR